MYKLFQNSQDIHTSCLGKPNSLKFHCEEKVLHYEIGKPPTYPARGLASTSPFAPLKIIILRLGLDVSSRASFLYTSLLLNSCAGWIRQWSHHVLRANEEQRGAGGSSGKNTCLCTRDYCSWVKQASSQTKLMLPKFSYLVQGHPARMWWRPFSQNRTLLEWLIHQTRHSFESSGIRKDIVNIVASSVFTFNSSNVGQCRPSREHLGISGTRCRGGLCFWLWVPQRSGMLRHAAMLKTFLHSEVPSVPRCK